ncbi:ribosome-binding protein 1 isoform X2 [Nematostella vectensis]|uniref:ribosome-binding protein 1 isoform X2 n=1 Tax=Nematostella vectensis TaxID=45351 RepID=UPI0020775AF8|nr:ribosome-binding protein 1 isoform X2 [Nematostella vectensis]
MEPVMLAGAAVVGIVAISLVLIALFSSRDDDFDDHVALQRAGLEATVSSRSSSKTTKTKKKFVKSKKKHLDHDSYSSESAEALDQENAKEFKDNAGEGNSGKKSDTGGEKPKSILKEQKKKGKKQVVKQEPPTPAERRAHFEDDSENVEEAITSEKEETNAIPITIVPEPVIVQEITPVTEAQVSSEPPATKKSKKQKNPKEKPTASGELSVHRLRESIKSANLSASEQQELIDVMLNKQGDSTHWQSTTKGDATDLLRKQLQEKEAQLMEEKKQAQNATNKLRELREEIQQERLKQKNQQTNASNKIASQAKELQAMQARIKASHESHTGEVQAMQTQLRQFQDLVSSVTMENAQLKNASMRAQQLNADKESLTLELTKLQQSHRQLKTDLAARVEQLKQVEGRRQMLEQQLADVSGMSANKDAEMALNKRLSEVNEELKKAESKNATLIGDLSSARESLKEKEANCKKLEQQLAEAVDSKSVNSDSMKTITAKLTEATNRVSELQNMFTSMETQLQKSQEKQVEKDNQIKELELKLKLAQEDPTQNHSPVNNHVEASENGQVKSPAVSLQIHNELLQEKETAINKLNEELSKRDQEIINMKNLVDQEKKKNNDLRMKNWKAMEALSTAEQNTQSLITKAVLAAKADAAKEALANSCDIKEKDDLISKLQDDLDNQKSELKKLEGIVEQQKQKNNDLREKNWKAMDAVSAAERSVGEKVKNAVQSVKEEQSRCIDEERTSMKNFLASLYPEVAVDSSLAFDAWLAEYKNSVSNLSPSSNQDDEASHQLEEAKRELEQTREKCAHYKNGLEETEAMLRKLEAHIEKEITTWEQKYQAAEKELQLANSRFSDLESDLAQAKSAADTHREKTNSLQKELAEAKLSESKALRKVSSLEETLSKAPANSNASEKLEQLEKELLESRENEKKSSAAVTRLEGLEKNLSSIREELATKEKDMASTVQQLCEVEGKLVTRESEVKSLREELTRMQQGSEELKKKIASLEESLIKANNEIGKSQESLDSIHNSPEKVDKKKKGLKGALGLGKLGGSKKDKESKADKERALEESQKQIEAFKHEIEELKMQNKKLSVSLETEMTRSQQIEKDVADAIADAAAKAANSSETTAL